MRIAIAYAECLSGNWWVVLLRGAAGVLFGIVTLFAPGLSLAALVLAFGAYALADGVLAIVSTIRRRGVGERQWWMLLLEGITGIGAALVTLFWPGISALALLFLIAAWAIVTGAFALVAAIQLRKAMTGEWLLASSGILSIALGVLLVMFPGAGALAVVLWIGAYALVFGTLLIVLAFRLRSWGRSVTAEGAAGAA